MTERTATECSGLVQRH